MSILLKLSEDGSIDNIAGGKKIGNDEKNDIDVEPS